MRTRQLVGGIDWSLTYTGEVFGLSSGGAENGAAYEHLIGLEIHTNLSKLVGWTGGSTHVSVYQIDDGSRNAADLVGAISDPSNIDARPTFRLFTLWAQQELGHFGSLRIGQIAADDEFLISKTAAALINSAFGWPEITAADLPGGGPVYPTGDARGPLATWAYRLDESDGRGVQRQPRRGLPSRGGPAGLQPPRHYV